MKKFFKAVLYTLVILLAFVVVALLIVPRFIPTEVYKRQIEKIVTEKSGMELEIKGDLSFSFIPKIKVTVEEVVLRDAEKKDFISLQSANINLKLIPLLKKNIEVSQFIINDLKINLGENKQFSFEFLENKIKMEALDRMLLINGGFKTGGRVFAHKIELNSLRNVLNKEIANLKFILNSSILDISYSGNILFDQNFSTDGRLEGDAKSVSSIAKVLNNVVAINPKPLPDSIKISTDLNLKNNIIETKKSIIVLSKNGDVIETDNNFKIDYGSEIPNIEALINITNDIKIDKFLPKNDESGENNEKKAKKEVAETAEASDGKSTATNTEIETFENEEVFFTWSKEKIDSSALNSINASIDLKTKGISYDDLLIDNTDIEIELQKGNLQVLLNKIALYGGLIEGNFGLNNPNLPIIKTNLSIKNLKADDIIVYLTNKDRFSGILDAKFNIAANGNNMYQIVKTLSGTGNIELKDGSLGGISLEEIIKNLKTNPAIVLDLWKNQPGKISKITEATASFNINNGLLDSRDIAIALPFASINGSGTTNLPNYTIDYKFIPTITEKMEGGESVLGKAKIPVTFTGTFNDGNIKYGVDLKGAAKSAAEEVIESEKEKLKEKVKSDVIEELNIDDESLEPVKEIMDDIFKKF